MIIERLAFERRIAASLEAGRIPVVLGPCGTGRIALLCASSACSATTGRSISTSQPRRRRRKAAWPPFSRRAVWTRRTCRTGDIGSRRVRRARRLLRRCGERRPATRHVPHRRGARRPDVRELPGAATCRASSSRGSRRARAVRLSRLASTRAHRWLRDAPSRFESSTCRRSTRRRSFARAALRRRAARLGGADCPGRGRAQRRPCRLRTPDRRIALDDELGDRSRRGGLFAPAGRLTARCRESYESQAPRARIRRAQGDPGHSRGARAAEPHRDRAAPAPHARLDEGLPVVARGRRSRHLPQQAVLVRGSAAPPGSPALRPALPPTDDEIVREVQAYAQARLSQAPARPSPEPAVVTVERIAESHARRDSGIVEID